VVLLQRARRRRNGVEGHEAVGRDSWVQGPAFRVRGDPWALHRYLTFPISYRDLAAMLVDRGLSVDHTTLLR
jgi:hypothetical protein